MEEATVTSFNILSESTEIIHVVLVFVQLVGMLSIVFSPLYIQLDTTAVNITFQMQKKKKKKIYSCGFNHHHFILTQHLLKSKKTKQKTFST